MCALPRQAQTPALVGVLGAVLAGVGDVLILGRGVSGPDFDRAVGVVPAEIEPVDRWRSLWNGAVLPRRRVHAGTLVGVLGIGLMGLGLREIDRVHGTGAPRPVTAGSAVAFTVAGSLTHLCCGTVILAYQRALHVPVEAAPGVSRPAPTSGTALLATSAVGSLGSLAVLSADRVVAALADRDPVPVRRVALTPFPFVLATLLTFGRLPAPVGGYARPASISTGLGLYFLVKLGGTMWSRRTT